MAQISDVMHASAVFDAARQELAWAYSGKFTDVPKPMKGAVHTISEVLNEAEMRWVTSSREEEPMAAVVDKENAMTVVDKEHAMAVVATGHEEKREDVGVVKDWLRRLEDVACDMRAVAREELLGDDYSRIDDNKLSARWFSCFPRTSRAARTSPTIDTVALELEKLKQQYEEFGHSTGLPLASTGTEQPACSSSAGGQETRDRDDVVKQRIIDIISDGWSLTKSPRIHHIVGPPCVGKTTLVKSVFHEDEDSFGVNFKVWVDMRKGWDINKIHESIIELLERYYKSCGRYNNVRIAINSRMKMKGEAYDVRRYIYQLLENEFLRLLLFLDNMVDSVDCREELLRSLHIFDKYVITIVITTRSEAWAKGISPVNPYRLHPYSDDMCWEIIKRTRGLDHEATAAGTYFFQDRGNNSEAAAVAVSEKVGIEIASNCSGIPLAAKALGRFLQFVDPQQWPGLIGDVWNIGGGFSSESQQLRRLPIHSATVFTNLKRSSGILRGAESWLSFAYCAFFVFPKGKGHGVVSRDLLNQWCSLGMTTRERGASCISELLDRSLLLGEKPTSYASEDVILLRMEDLMHGFARYHLGDRLIIVDGKNGAVPSTISSSPVNNNNSSSAYLALVSNFDAKQLDISSILPAGILALRFEGCGEMELSDGAFESFGKYLRLLDLSGYSEKKMLPDFIGHLKQLRYLKAPEIQDQEFPRSITGLHELRYLILQGSCQLENLTEAFQWLTNLLHLDLSGCTKLKALPKSFGRLWRLEHLDLSACSEIEALPELFGWFPNLSHLDLSGCSGLKALPVSSGLNRLWHLDLSGCTGLQDLPTSFQHLTELRYLDLSGLFRLQALPMVSLPRELRHLNLSGCTALQTKGLPNAPESSELRHLDLSGCLSVSELPGSYATLEKLVHLNMSGCASIELARGRWTSQLEHLDLSYCLLSRLNHLDLDLQKLRYLDLSGAIFAGKPEAFISSLVETIKSRGGRATGPEDVPNELVNAFWKPWTSQAV